MIQISQQSMFSTETPQKNLRYYVPVLNDATGNERATSDLVRKWHVWFRVQKLPSDMGQPLPKGEAELEKRMSHALTPPKISKKHAIDLWKLPETTFWKFDFETSFDQ